MLDARQQLQMVSAWITLTNTQKGAPVVYAGHRSSPEGLVCRFFVLRPVKDQNHYGELTVPWPAVKQEAEAYGFNDIVEALS